MLQLRCGRSCATSLGTLHSQGKLDPFKSEDIKVLVLDNVRGVTADYVHVIRGERFIGAQKPALGHPERPAKGVHQLHPWQAPLPRLA